MKRTAITISVFVLLLAACADSGTAAVDGVASLDEGVATTSSTTPRDGEIAIDEAILDFVQCLRDEGLEVQDPDLSVDGPLGLKRQFVENEGDTIAPEVEAAFAACDDMRADMSSRFEAEDSSELEDRLLAFSECMRTEGVIDFPDPDLSVWAPGAGLGPGNGPYGDWISKIQGDGDPSTTDALGICQALYGGAGTGNTGGGDE